jgi:hypothetical protein
MEELDVMAAAAVVAVVGHDDDESHELQPLAEAVVARTVVAEVGVEDIGLHPRQPPSKSEGFQFLTCKVGCTRFTVFDPFLLSPIQRTLLNRLGFSTADSCTLG